MDDPLCISSVTIQVLVSLKMMFPFLRYQTRNVLAHPELLPYLRRNPKLVTSFAINPPYRCAFYDILKVRPFVEKNAVVKKLMLEKVFGQPF